MKTSPLLRSLGGLCLAIFITAAASAFEGKVDMKMTSNGNEKDATSMSYRIKDTKMRIDMSDVSSSSSKKKKKKDEDAQGAMIMDFQKKEMIILMPSEKMYMVRTIEEPKESTKKKKGDEDFKATGRKEKIAGIQAEEYVGKNDGRIIEVWVTKEMGKYMSQQGASGKGGAGWESFMQQENAFPLRVISRKKADGPEESRMETTAIDRSKQDASLFTPPGDYQKFEMPGFGDMMKGMIPGR